MPVLQQIQIRGGTAAAWTTANPVLLAREIGLETNTRKFKVGDGVTNWSGLTYWVADGSGGGGTGLDAEGVRDTIASALLGTGLITVTPNDAGDSIVVSTTATANAADAFLTARGNHSGTQDLTTITETAGLKVMTAAERTKLAAIATAATANAADAFLLDRGNHTGEQSTSTITALAEYIRDTVAAFVVAGAGASAVHNDASDTLTIGATGAVTSVNGQTGVVSLTIPAAPVTATTATAGIVRLATDLEVESGAAGRVPTATQLRAEIDAIVTDPVSLPVVFSATVPETGATGTSRAYVARTIAEAHLRCEAAPVGSALTCNVQHYNGTSWTTVATLTIAAGASTLSHSVTGLTTAQSVGHLLRLNVTSVGSTTPAQKPVVDVLFA